MKYKAKTKECRLLVKAKTSFGESIDEKALDAFARIYLRGFLKPKLIKRCVIEYSGPVGISLCDRLKKPITKRDFFAIMEQVVEAIRKIYANSLSMNRLVMDIHYVYINEITKEMQFLYVPTVGELPNAGVTAFIESIVYSTTPADERDAEYVSRFVYFLKGLKGFDPDKVEGFITREDRSVVSTIKKQNAGQSGFMTSKQKDYYAHYDPVENKDEDEPTGLLSEEESFEDNDEEGTACLEEDEATGLLDDEATGLLTPDDEEGTALLDDSWNVRFPTLYRVLTEETISVNKPVFRLGKERSYVDYFVTNNNAVSRSHADIITRGSRHFILDLNSTNHTYINDQMVPIQCETEIRDGDRLRLGNEEFIFQE